MVEVNGQPFQVHVRAVQSADGTEKYTEEYGDRVLVAAELLNRVLHVRHAPSQRCALTARINCGRTGVEHAAPLSDPLLREYWQLRKLAPPPSYVPKAVKFRWGLLHLLRRFLNWYRGMVLESYEAFREWRLKLV